jgi:hypothetical protein
MKTNKYYKLAKLDGWDFRTGNSVNYRENIGKTITVPSFGKYGKKPHYELCTDMVLHASLKPLQCFIGASLPCSAFIVEGKSVVYDTEKHGFTKLTVLKEIPQDKLAELFGFDYLQAVNPIHPLKLKAPTITNVELLLLQNWASVWDSVRASVWDSVRASVWDSVWDSVRDSVRASVRDSVWDSVWDSVRASVWAYIGSMFPNIKTWKYTPTNIQGYPFQSCVDLWHKGIVPSFDGTTYRLHTSVNARIAYEISAKKLRELQFIVKEGSEKQ